MDGILCGLAIFAIFAILLVLMEIYFSYAKIAPKNKIAGNIWCTYSQLRKFVLQNKKGDYARVALVFASLLAICLITCLALSYLVPYILLLALLVFIFFPSKTSGNTTAPQSPWLAPPIDITRYTMSLVLRKLAAYSASHMRAPTTEYDLQIQPCTFREVPVFQICYDKDDSPEDVQENHIMLTRINSHIRQCLQSEQIPGIAYPIDGDLFACVSVRNMGIYWELYIIYTPEGFATFFPQKIAPPTRISDRTSTAIKAEKKRGIPICLDGELLKEGIKSPVFWNYERDAHMLIIGNTGSGKTKAAEVVLVEVSKLSESKVWLCDWKADDFYWLKGCARYYQFMDCIKGLNDFYSMFQARQQGIDDERTFRLLVFDEWVAFLNTLDKQEAESAKKQLATLSMLGRSFNVHIILVQQYALAEYFGKSRDNFSVVAALGNLSKESCSMFGFNRDEMEKITNPGEGYMLTTGVDQKGIAFPFIQNNKITNQMIAEAVTR